MQSTHVRLLLVPRIYTRSNISAMCGGNYLMQTFGVCIKLKKRKPILNEPK